MLLERDKSKQCYPVKEILLDDEFNHRGKIRLIDVAALSADIKKKGGLILPISIREIEHPKYKYQVIDGHRRLTAYQRLGAEMIPAVLEVANEFDAKTFSAVANLQRQDLNIMQEANSIKHLWIANLSRSAIAGTVSMSPGWVQIRCDLLAMDDGVKKIAMKGFLTQEDIRTIGKLPRKEQASAAFEIHKQRENGKRITLRKKEKRSTKRNRRSGEINKMMEEFRAIMLEVELDVDVSSSDLISNSGDCIATSFASWCAGYIDNYTFHKRIQEFCELFGHTYVIPLFD